MKNRERDNKNRVKTGKREKKTDWERTEMDKKGEAKSKKKHCIQGKRQVEKERIKRQ